MKNTNPTRKRSRAEAATPRDPRNELDDIDDSSTEMRLTPEQYAECQRARQARADKSKPPWLA